MKAQLLLLFLSQNQQFLRQQQGQLHMHDLACKTRRSIIYSSQKMVKFSNKKGHSRSLARREGSSEEVMAQTWEENHPVLDHCIAQTLLPQGWTSHASSSLGYQEAEGDGAMWSPFFL